MLATGIDIGGTKIETRVFDTDWTEMRRTRISTPADYDMLVQAVADQIAWAGPQCGPIGIGSAGLVHPQTGVMSAANLSAHGHPFPKDIRNHAGQPVHFINDARAFGLSEAVFGAGLGHQTVAALVLGTGIGGAIIANQTARAGPTATGGEFGHTAAAAHLVDQYDLPIFDCGCGRQGCLETYISGRGLSRLAQHLTGVSATPQMMAANRDGTMSTVWTVWCALLSDLIVQLTLTVDPDVIVIGGGLSQIDGLIDALTQTAQSMQINGFDVPPIVLAQGGDASGARGAAYAAWQASADD